MATIGGIYQMTGRSILTFRSRRGQGRSRPTAARQQLDGPVRSELRKRWTYQSVTASHWALPTLPDGQWVSTRKSVVTTCLSSSAGENVPSAIPSATIRRAANVI
jgi:hypothetical protein